MVVFLLLLSQIIVNNNIDIGEMKNVNIDHHSLRAINIIFGLTNISLPSSSKDLSIQILQLSLGLRIKRNIHKANKPDITTDITHNTLLASSNIVLYCSKAKNRLNNGNAAEMAIKMVERIICVLKQRNGNKSKPIINVVNVIDIAIVIIL